MKYTVQYYHHVDGTWKQSMVYPEAYATYNEALSKVEAAREINTDLKYRVEKLMQLTQKDTQAIEQPDTRPPVEHYMKLTPEPIDVIDGWGLDFYDAQVIKYLARAGKKQGEDEIKDRTKARDYLQRKIAILEGRKNSWQ